MIMLGEPSSVYVWVLREAGVRKDFLGYTPKRNFAPHLGHRFTAYTGPAWCCRTPGPITESWTRPFYYSASCFGHGDTGRPVGVVDRTGFPSIVCCELPGPQPCCVECLLRIKPFRHLRDGAFGESMWVGKQASAQSTCLFQKKDAMAVQAAGCHGAPSRGGGGC